MKPGPPELVDIAATHPQGESPVAPAVLRDFT